MTTRLAALLCLMLAAVAAAAWPVAQAEDPAAAVVSGAPPHPTISGWTHGPKAAGTADLLAQNPAVIVALPQAITAKVSGPTALFYFSPTCPHCQHVMPEANALAAMDGLSWLGVATSRSTQAEIDAFAAEYAAAFPLVSDADGAFAMAIGARSTPIVLLVRPAPDAEGAAVNAAAITGGVKVELFDAYQPFSRGLGPVLRARLHPDEPFADFDGYQGDLVCSTCHSREARSWALSHHSVAYRTLYERERVDDPKCVSCHVTGMRDGGFEMGDHTSIFTDVTCESCHGPSGPHDGDGADPKALARASCVGCHDAEHSVAFSLDKGLPHIDHFRDGAMTPDQIQARLTALGTGTADKPLLAFPDGPTVGSKACQGCHPTQHAWAKKDGHRDAMRHLKGDDKAAGCVRCHATPTAMSSLAPNDPTDLSQWRTGEGVGCESCHGPGGAHAAAPSKANIVGLGDSCPECVIEAICTSCHTPEWDAGWSLHPRLEAIDH